MGAVVEEERGEGVEEVREEEEGQPRRGERGMSIDVKERERERERERLYSAHVR